MAVYPASNGTGSVCYQYYMPYDQNPQNASQVTAQKVNYLFNEAMNASFLGGAGLCDLNGYTVKGKTAQVTGTIPKQWINSPYYEKYLGQPYSYKATVYTKAESTLILLI